MAVPVVDRRSGGFSGDGRSASRSLSLLGPSMSFRFVPGWCGVWLALVAVFGCTQQEQGAAKIPPTEVTVAKPLQRDVAEYEEFTGRTEAVESVEIRVRVTGYLEKIYFQEGGDVKADDPLFEIDARPYQAQYDMAAARVKLSEAQVELQKAELARNEPLAKKGAISQADFDKIVASAKEAAASVESAKANLESADLNLKFTKLSSPIAGRVSRTLMTKGNLVTADTTALTNIVSQDPMYTYFDVDERTVLRLMQMVKEGKLPARHDASESPLAMALANDVGFPHQGVIDFVDNQVDSSTGTVKVRAKFPNPAEKTGTHPLAPGFFVRVRIPIGQPHPALLVAERAIGTDQGQKYLLVVNAKNEVEYRPVKLGKLENGLRVIEEGLQGGEQVIVIGLQRARPGKTVEPKAVDMTSFLTKTGN
jgi:RND family efflux transporter MFP subunit